MIKTFISLFLSFSTINVVNRIIPLISIPLLTNNLGLDSYGEYVIILSYYVLFDTLVNYGFKTTAVIDLGMCESITQESNLFHEIFFSKLILSIPSIFILSAIISHIGLGKFESISFSSLIIFSAVLNQEWFYHGKGKMKSVLIIYFFNRLIYLLAIFIFVKSPLDLYKALIIFSFTQFLQSFLCFSIAFREFELQTSKGLSLKSLIIRYLNNFYFFSANLSSYFYTSFNYIILDQFYSPALIGIYGIADRFINAIRDFSNTFHSAILPILSFRSNRKNKYIFLIYTISVFMVFTVIATGVIFLSDYIFTFFSSENVENNIGSSIIKILSLGLPITVVIGSLSQVYLINNESKTLFIVITLFSIISVTISILISSLYEIKYFAISNVSLMVILLTFLTIKLKYLR